MFHLIQICRNIAKYFLHIAKYFLLNFLQLEVFFPNKNMCSGFKAVCPTGVLDRNGILEMYDMPMKTAIRFLD